MSSDTGMPCEKSRPDDAANRRSRKSPDATLWLRMKELGLEPNDVAGRADVDRIWIDELQCQDHLETWPVKDVKRVLEVLGVDFLELFGIKCAYCGKGQKHIEELGSLPRNELIKRRREQLGLTKEELLDKAGWTAWFADKRDKDWAQRFMSEYRGIEDSPDAIDELGFWDIKHTNKVLKLPLQLLLGVKCPKCGR